MDGNRCFRTSKNAWDCNHEKKLVLNVYLVQKIGKLPLQTKLISANSHESFGRILTIFYTINCG